MLRITGYTDRCSVRPGEDVTFFVHSELEESYRADIVRLIHGDTNPDGPGIKEKLVRSAVNKRYRGRHQPVHAGSYVMVPHDPRLDVQSFTLCAYVYPTTPEVDTEGVAVGTQAILSKWNAKTNTGYGLFINERGELALKIGRGRGDVVEYSTRKPLFRKVWYKVAATFDAVTGEVRIWQTPFVTMTNGGHGMSLLHPIDDTAGSARYRTATRGPRATDCPLLFAASTEQTDSGRSVGGAHYGHLAKPWPIPVHTQKYNGKIERAKLANRALSAADVELLLASAGMENVPGELRGAIVGAWDFAANIAADAASTHIVDAGPNRLHGIGVNLPVRGVTGFNWSSDFMSFRHGPHEYGAIHFHDESVDDARWAPSFTFKVPANLPSGVYAARLRVDDSDSPECEDYVPFFVRPPADGPRARIALVIAMHSYLAYANDNLSVNSVIAQLLTGQVPLLQPGDLLLNKERGYGLGTYTSYRDGWGVNISSRLRPILNMRPKYVHVLSPSLWQFNADLHLVDWLYEAGYDVDILVDEDVQREGVALLNQYRIVLTGHHPEYISEQQMQAYQDYQQQGGRFMYLAANGFYWICQPHPENPNIVEVRKGDNGTRAWTISPGEYCNAFDGKHGGLWRVRGRVMSKLLGVTFTSFGLTYSSYYRRAPDSELPECKWMFKGIGRDEPIGNFGLVGDGAAGLELDRYDLELGTPHRAYLLAHSEGHSDMFVSVTEESTFNARGYIPGGTGDNNPRTRADIVYYKTPNDGAVFSVGSMSWCGSLSHNAYDNNVSRLMKNVIDGFLKNGPLP
ncbi:MAG: N,N-dimethylformamidase [Gammaproteobacteria bacterium]|nr:N,N-dimethylformamidase [Gammaproteobacteria bacterium]